MSTLNRLSLVLVFLLSTVAPASAQTEPNARATSLRSLALSAPLPPDWLERAQTTRENDPLWNGALIGAATGLVGSRLLCRAMEPWDVCLNDVGSMLTSAAIGAAIGIGIDALIRRTTGPPGAARARRPDARRWSHSPTTPERR